MSKLCEGRRGHRDRRRAAGMGREHALMLAEHGAKVVVNDLGADEDGSGADLTPPSRWSTRSAHAGGEAVVNGDDVSDWDRRPAMMDQAVDTFGTTSTWWSTTPASCATGCSPT
jgi:NAD(P)-dependent dehydrogenase (short-subunit alcohol dehydrogenase family)